MNNKFKSLKIYKGEANKVKPRYPIIAATVAMIAATGNAYAVLNSYNTLTIQNDAVSTYDWNEANTATEWYVSSDGPLLDSFFTTGGSTVKNPAIYSFGFAYLDSEGSSSLNGSPQSNIASAPNWYNESNDPNGISTFSTLGTGISILSASGDSATVDMSGWTDTYFGYSLWLGSGAWSDGYSNGVGNITCTTGSGCAVGSAYTLKYTSTVSPLDPTPLKNVKFYVELHGTVGAVPEASTYGMMLAGLGAIGLMVRRRKRANSWPNN